MPSNIARTLNELGVGLTAIAAMSKLPRATNQSARKWCNRDDIPQRVADALGRAALPVWGQLKRQQHPRSTELWRLMNLAEHPHLCHVLIYVCDVPPHFVAKAAGVSPATVTKWLHRTEHLSDNVKDRLSGLYRETVACLEREDDGRDIILAKAWRRKKPPSRQSAVVKCLEDYKTHCPPTMSLRQCRAILEARGHHRSVIYLAAKSAD